MDHHSLCEKAIPGNPSTKNAKFTINIFESSVERTILKEFDAVVTCPINKEVINKAILVLDYLEKNNQLNAQIKFK